MPPIVKRTQRTATGEIVAFPSQKAWARWLSAHHKTSNGVWLQLFKKGSNVESITHDEALEEALCHGWIDGQVKKYDAASWLQKFTPRRKKSTWSRKNTEHVGRLITAGRMKARGLAEVEAARQDGRWASAYDSPSQASMPDDLVDALSRNKKARAFFETLNKANRYAITWRLQTARRPETRARRLKAIVAMLAQGQAFHP
jgi:uncharacterized protein YdeI (YjbR/CyaY-like superfamily)